MTTTIPTLTAEQQKIRELSERIVQLQQPIRILDAIKWDDTVKQDFFANQCQKLPPVDADYYQQHPLTFDADELVGAFRVLKRDIKNNLGQYTDISRIMLRACEEYMQAITMLASRGKPMFSQLAMELYGAPDDAFYPGGPRLSELGTMLGEVFAPLAVETATELDEKRYTASAAASVLQERLAEFFNDADNVTVVVSDNIVADAAAGADCIRLNSNVKFSERDLRYLEVHEGWVHVGTTLNGAKQPICTFLAKGAPSSSICQEGLAVITEIFTFSSYPRRMQKIVNRIRALSMVTDGANFIDIFRFFQQQGFNDEDAYNSTARVFRGSLPDGQPFTKDLSYAKGFVLIYNYLRLSVQQGRLDHVPLLFVGKTLIEDIQVLRELHQQGLVVSPHYLPPQFRDLSALSSWMGFSLFLNRFDLGALAAHYGYVTGKS